MSLCQADTKDTSNTIKNMNELVMTERLRSAEFEAISNIIQDLDSNNPVAFPLLYEFKRDDIDA